jgi:hypothetical protein
MKINLDQNETNALEQFEGSGMNAVAVIKKILDTAISFLGSIENIDPKGNMGLQTLANQNAVKEIKEIRDQIFSSVAVKNNRPVSGEKKPVSQYR